MIQRHQDYQITIPIVPPGGLEDVGLQLDSDAAFCLRRVLTRNLATPWRFKLPRGNYESTHYRPPVMPYPIYPQATYQASAVIRFDVPNTTGENLENVKILFRGWKLYKPGAVAAPSYPARCSLLPGFLPLVVENLGESGPTGTRLNIPINIPSRADFAIRMGVADSFRFNYNGAQVPSGTYTNLYVLLKDVRGQGYSNEPIHIDDLFGSDLLADNLRPGLFTPEIYMERNSSLYMDIFRDDSEGGEVDLHFRFDGAQVYHR